MLGFETKRLKIREFCKSDIDVLFALLSDSQVMEYCSGALEYAQAQEWLDSILLYYQRLGYDYWAVEDKKTGEFIGQAGLIQQEIDGIHLNCIAFMICKERWGNGYATESAGACISYAKENLKLNELYATVEKDNLASKRILEKAGMTYLRDAICFGKRVSLYSI